MNLRPLTPLLLAFAASAAAAQSPRQAAEASFQSLKHEVEAMQATTLDGRVQRVVLSGEPCRSTLTVALAASDLSRARSFSGEYRWADVDEPNLVNILAPLVVISDDEGFQEINFDSVDRAERAVGFINGLRRHCRNR